MFVVGGESLIDLIGKPGGAREFVAKPGGSPMNCAIALARLGVPTGFLCPISADRFGDDILAPLARAGVTPLLTERVAAPTTLAVVSDDGKGNPRYAFYREADRAFTRDGLIAALPAAPKLFQIGGFCAIEPDDIEAWCAAADTAAQRGAVLAIDPNVRPSLIADMPAYRARLTRLLERVHIVKMSEEDLAALDGDKSLDAHAAELLARPNCALVVVTRGASGSLAFTRGARAAAGIFPAAPGGDNVGAGDTLMAGMLAWLDDHDALSPARLAALDAGALKSMLWFGAVAAGINCGRVGADPPTRTEVSTALERPGGR